jgi:hypothetical protein
MVNVFEGIDFVFEREFLILEFLKMKKNGVLGVSSCCAVSALIS